MKFQMSVDEFNGPGQLRLPLHPSIPCDRVTLLVFTSSRLELIFQFLDEPLGVDNQHIRLGLVGRDITPVLDGLLQLSWTLIFWVQTICELNERLTQSTCLLAGRVTQPCATFTLQLCKAECVLLSTLVIELSSVHNTPHRMSDRRRLSGRQRHECHIELLVFGVLEVCTVRPRNEGVKLLFEGHALH